MRACVKWLVCSHCTRACAGGTPHAGPHYQPVRHCEHAAAQLQRQHVPAGPEVGHQCVPRARGSRGPHVSPLAGISFLLDGFLSSTPTRLLSKHSAYLMHSLAHLACTCRAGVRNAPAVPHWHCLLCVSVCVYLCCVAHGRTFPGPDGGASANETVSWYGLDVFPQRETSVGLIGRDMSSRRQHREGLQALHNRAPAGSLA